jgi:hypothetical protein
MARLERSRCLFILYIVFSLACLSSQSLTLKPLSHFAKGFKGLGVSLSLIGSVPLIIDPAATAASSVIASPTSVMSVTAAAAAGVVLVAPRVAVAEGSDESLAIRKVPLFNKKSSDVQPYSDVSRGFRLLRPFGFNEFEGAGGGYLVKFASLFDVDENVVVGSAPATAGKTSITDYGDIQQLGNKLASKRGGKLLSTDARETEGIVYYVFQFENPLDASLPRPGSRSLKPESVIELYSLCVAKGRLWSVQATANDKNFPQRERVLRAAIDSFIPRL